MQRVVSETWDTLVCQLTCDFLLFVVPPFFIHNNTEALMDVKLFLNEYDD